MKSQDNISAPVSVCIITNEDNDQLARTILSYSPVVDEVCIGVNGRVNILKLQTQFSDLPYVKFFPMDWEGYGCTKNKLQEMAKNDWVLSADADEEASEGLKSFLLTFSPPADEVLYQFKRVNLLSGKLIKFGSWGKVNMYIPRLFNKRRVHWNTEDVHETLNVPEGARWIKTEHVMLHYSAKDIEEVRQKNRRYAQLWAVNKWKQGKTTYFMKKYVAGVYTFFKEYILFLGMLDGWSGFRLAQSFAQYSFVKYKVLYALQNGTN